MRYSHAMKSAAVAIVVLLSTVGVRAQDQREHSGRPLPAPAPFVPKVLSTGGITTLPPPPPPSPFAARPDTYVPRYDRSSPFRPGHGDGVSIYSGTFGFVPYAPYPAPAAPPLARDQGPVPVAPAPEPPKAAQPLPEPPPEPRSITMAHGPDTFYVIPGCYAGNIRPNPERLPKACDVSMMRTTPIR